MYQPIRIHRKLDPGKRSGGHISIIRGNYSQRASIIFYTYFLLATTTHTHTLVHTRLYHGPLQTLNSSLHSTTLVSPSFSFSMLSHGDDPMRLYARGRHHQSASSERWENSLQLWLQGRLGFALAWHRSLTESVYLYVRPVHWFASPPTRNRVCVRRHRDLSNTNELVLSLIATRNHQFYGYPFGVPPDFIFVRSGVVSRLLRSFEVLWSSCVEVSLRFHLHDATSVRILHLFTNSQSLIVSLSTSREHAPIPEDVTVEWLTKLVEWYTNERKWSRRDLPKNEKHKNIIYLVEYVS